MSLPGVVKLIVCKLVPIYLKLILYYNDNLYRTEYYSNFLLNSPNIGIIFCLTSSFLKQKKYGFKIESDFPYSKEVKLLAFNISPPLLLKKASAAGYIPFRGGAKPWIKISLIIGKRAYF
jgi:hypothetical protein